MLLTATLAQQAAKVSYNHFPQRTYAVGTSNGGYQVRRAMEEAPDLFDGGVDWEGTFIDPSGPNILIDLPPAIKNFPDYAASNFNPNSQAALARGPRRVQLAAASQPVCTQGRRDLAEPWRFTLGQLRRPVRALNNPSDKAEEGSGDSSSFFELVLAPLHQPKVKLQRALERQSGHLPERKTPPERGQCAHLGT